MIYVVGHDLSHAFALSNFSNHPKAETVNMCFHDCLLVVQHPSATLAAFPMNYGDLEPCSCEEYCEILMAELVATVWQSFSRTRKYYSVLSLRYTGLYLVLDNTSNNILVRSCSSNPYFKIVFRTTMLSPVVRRHSRCYKMLVRITKKTSLLQWTPPW